jgi:hypothetical protein
MKARDQLGRKRAWTAADVKDSIAPPDPREIDELRSELS